MAFNRVGGVWGCGKVFLVMSRKNLFFFLCSAGAGPGPLALVKPEDSRVLSKVCLYLVTPCVIINAFQLQRTPELLQGLALSLGPPLASTLCFHCHGLTAPPPASDAGGTGLPDLHQFR